jgi:hypothetical protein
MKTACRGNSFKRSIQAGVLLCGFMAGAAVAQTQTEFSWKGKGDGTSWSDAKNWTEGVVPTGSGTDWRPSARIDVSGAEVTISKKVPRFFGDINVGAGGKGCTLSFAPGSALQMQGSLRIGEKGFGTFNMTGGKLEIGVWGARDLRIGNGVMNFGSPAAETAPEIKVVEASRGFGSGLNREEDSEVNLSGFGSITTAERACFSLYGKSVLNVAGGNLRLVFDTKATGLNRIGGDARSYKAVVNYTLDAAGASTMHFGGDVVFGEAEFNLALGDGFSAKPGDVFTIVSTQGNFTGQKGFSNVSDGAEISAGGYTFKAAYTCDASGKDTFTLTIVSGNTVG